MVVCCFAFFVLFVCLLLYFIRRAEKDAFKEKIIRYTAWELLDLVCFTNAAAFASNLKSFQLFLLVVDPCY